MTDNKTEMAIPVSLVVVGSTSSYASRRYAPACEGSNVAVTDAAQVSAAKVKSHSFPLPHPASSSSNTGEHENARWNEQYQSRHRSQTPPPGSLAFLQRTTPPLSLSLRLSPAGVQKHTRLRRPRHEKKSNGHFIIYERECEPSPHRRHTTVVATLLRPSWVRVRATPSCRFTSRRIGKLR
ncbi:unnamed protein product [Schistocephalus solidus]|uniref:Secreted protein n=1 Tax=Schistocephalus solidus TaxID=70667 RepID=A0A183SI17_SCHSO|nr:unnamed protein product [Schistocephalus solidus]